jgi:hypothetical protein
MRAMLLLLPPDEDQVVSEACEGGGRLSET